MIRYATPLSLLVLLSSSAIVACDKPGDTEQKKEATATAQATEAMAQANHSAQTAQVQADRDITAARSDFEKSRADYRQSKQRDLADLDKKISDLQAKEMTATGKTKSDLDGMLPGLRAQRDAFVRDMQALDATSPAAWDEKKTSLDAEWSALKSALDRAS